MTTGPEERTPPEHGRTLPDKAAEPPAPVAAPAAVKPSTAVPPPSGAKDPAAESGGALKPRPTKWRSRIRSVVKWVNGHRVLSGLGTLVVTVLSTVLANVITSAVQPADNGASRTSTPTAPAHAFTITVAYGSPLHAPGAMALPTSAIGQLPNVVTDWDQQPPGPVTQAILAKGPAELGENEFRITLQNPAGQDTVEVEGLSAKILQTTAPYSGALFRFPSQGSGPTPEVAIDLDSADPYARTWDAGSAMLGQNYFLNGNYIDVGGGDSQSVEVFAFAKQAAYAYDVQVTVLQDGRTWTITETADNHGTPFRVTGAASSYTEAYIDQHPDSPTSYGLILTQTPWSRCTSVYGSVCSPFVEPFSINPAAQ